MFKIVDRYVARNVAIMVVYCTIGLVLMGSLIKFVDQLRNLGKGTFDVYTVLWYVFCLSPGQILMFFPLGVLLGTVLALGNLASSSELIAMQSVGKSKMSIVWSACVGVIPLIILVMVMGEFVVPRAEKYAEVMSDEAISNGQIVVTTRGVWFREENSFINISTVMSDGELRNVNRFVFTDTFPKKLLTHEYAISGYWNSQDKTWKMEKVYVTEHNGPNIKMEFKDSVVWNLILTPNKLDVLSIGENQLSMSGLVNYIDYMTKNGQKADKYTLKLYRKIFSPITVLVVLLLAASTIFGPLRSASMGARVVVGILVGFAFYATNEILAPFTIFYGVPPIVGAIFPTFICLGGAIYLLRRRT